MTSESQVQIVWGLLVPLNHPRILYLLPVFLIEISSLHLEPTYTHTHTHTHAHTWTNTSATTSTSTQSFLKPFAETLLARPWHCSPQLESKTSPFPFSSPSHNPVQKGQTQQWGGRRNGHPSISSRALLESSFFTSFLAAFSFLHKF